MAQDSPTRSPALSLEDFAALNDQLAAMVRAGVPFEQGLVPQAGTLPGSLEQLTRTLQERLSRGETLPQALAADERIFPAFYRALVQAGWKTGRLAETLSSLATIVRDAAELRRQVLLACLYPLIVIVTAYALFTLIVLPLLIPSIRDTYRDLRQPLTGVIQFLSAVEQFPPAWRYLVPLIGGVGLLGWWWSASRARGFLRGLGGPWRWIPGYRRVLSNTVHAQLADMLALMLERELPLDQALELALDAVGWLPLRQDGARVVAGLREGRSWPDLLSHVHNFPPGITWLLASPPARLDQLVQGLRTTAQGYRQSAQFGAEWLQLFVPNGLILLVGGGVCLLYGLTLFWPLKALLRTLSLD